MRLRAKRAYHDAARGTSSRGNTSSSASATTSGTRCSSVMRRASSSDAPFSCCTTVPVRRANESSAARIGTARLAAAKTTTVSVVARARDWRGIRGGALTASSARTVTARRQRMWRISAHHDSISKSHTSRESSLLHALGRPSPLCTRCPTSPSTFGTSSSGTTSTLRSVISRSPCRAAAVYGLLGPNGAGKTTTIRMLLNIIVPDSGTITLLGTPHRTPG